MDAAQTSQATAARTKASPIGQLDAGGIAHHHVLHVATPVDEHTDLAADLGADLGQVAGKLVGEESVGRQASSEETLELPYLTGFEPMGVSKNLD